MNPNHPLVNYPYNTSIYAHRTSPEQIYLAKRNLNELTTLINRRFDQYSRLLIIRVDLKYKPEVALTVPIEVVQMHREQLLGNKDLAEKLTSRPDELPPIPPERLK